MIVEIGPGGRFEKEKFMDFCSSLKGEAQGSV